MFGMGLPELILILVVALVIIGPKKLPDMAKALGRAMGEFRRATSDFKEAIDLDDNLRELKDVKNSLTEIKDEVRSTVSFDDITKGLSSDQKTDDKDTSETPGPSDAVTGGSADTSGGATILENDTATDAPPADQKEPDPHARG